jgi:hypothetical protein
MSTAAVAAKTTARAPAELAVGGVVKFGRDDFREVARLEVKEWGATWIFWTSETTPKGGYVWCDAASRKSWRVVVR